MRGKKETCRKQSLCVGLCLCLLLALLGSGCGAAPSLNRAENEDLRDGTVSDEGDSDGAPAISGLTFEQCIPTEYAQGFQIFCYEGGYRLIAVSDGRSYLIVPPKKEPPKKLPGDIVVLQQPLTQVYLASSSTAALLAAIGATDAVRFSALEEKDWHVEEMKRAMEAEEILFAGKYSRPDYELLLEEHCTLAVENTMILHSPEVQEKIQEMGIPVFIDRSSYEEHPLGRTEWILVYGELFQKGREAADYFAGQKAQLDGFGEENATGQTVVFFHINASGAVITRKSGDYVPKMIALAGGRYVFDDLGAEEENHSSSVNMTMDEFYARAKDADYIIYNGTIEQPLASVEELLDKNSLFKDFKAVQNNHVWCCRNQMYQATDATGDIIREMHLLLTKENPQGLTYFYQVP